MQSNAEGYHQYIRGCEAIWRHTVNKSGGLRVKTKRYMDFALIKEPKRARPVYMRRNTSPARLIHHYHSLLCYFYTNTSSATKPSTMFLL